MTPKELANQLRAELDDHLATIRRIADQIEAMDTIPAPVLPILPSVPYRSQWDADALAFKSDCGPACVTMLLDLRNIHVSVDDLARACGLGPGKVYTTGADLARAAKSFALSLETVSGWSLEQFVARAPCIVLVHYGAMDRLDANYTAGHWVVLLGLQDGQAIYHDPDWWGPRRNEGIARKVAREKFALAMRECAADGNPAGYGLVLV